MFKAEVRLLSESARVPVRAKPTDACWDIHSLQNYEVHPGVVTTVRTGVAISVPPGYYYTIDPRSGLLFGENIWIGRGIIDATYTGEILVRIHNKSNQIVYVRTGDRCAQLTFHEVIEPTLVVVEDFSPEYNVRGTAGFGSSGK